MGLGEIIDLHRVHEWNSLEDSPLQYPLTERDGTYACLEHLHVSAVKSGTEIFGAIL